MAIERQAPGLQALETLLAAARNGNRVALGEVFRRYEKTLLRIARGVLPADLQPKAGASDLLQDTFFEAQRDFRQFHGTTREELLAWLQCLLRNNWLNFVRAYRRREKRLIQREEPLCLEPWRANCSRLELATRAAGPGTDAIRNESTERCRRAIGGLPDDERMLLRLRFEECLTFSVIGARLDMSAEAARKLLGRTLRKLSGELGAS